MSFKFAKTLGSQNKTSSRPEPEAKSPLSKFAFLLWFIPLAVSAYLLTQSPNIIKEVKHKDTRDHNNHKIQSVLSEISNDNPQPQREAVHEPEPAPVEPRQNDIHSALYYCEIGDDIAKLVSVPYRSSSGDNQVADMMNHLISPPSNLQDRYQSLIPRNSKLLDHRLDGDLLILNFNESFLNDYYGDSGKKLKVAQIVKTMISLPGVRKVVFEVNGRRVPYLDRDGIIANIPMSGDDLNNGILSD